MKHRDDAARRNLFCMFVARGFSPEEAVRRAGLSCGSDPGAAAAELLAAAAVRRRIGRYTKELAFCSPSARARAGLERIALGDVSGAASLLCGDGDCIPAGADLFSVAEIKKPKGGGLEIKFFDRLRALSLLAELGTDAEDSAGSLLAALTGSVDGNGGDSDEQV